MQTKQVQIREFPQPTPTDNGKVLAWNQTSGKNEYISIPWDGNLTITIETGNAPVSPTAPATPPSSPISWDTVREEYDDTILWWSYNGSSWTLESSEPNCDTCWGGIPAPTAPAAPFQSGGYAQAPSGNPAGAADGSTAYTCWDILLGWTAAAWADSYDIYEGATLVANVLAPNTTYTVVWPLTLSTWHTYSVYARQWPQSSTALVIWPVQAVVCIPSGSIINNLNYRPYNHTTKTLWAATNAPSGSQVSSIYYPAFDLWAGYENNPVQYGIIYWSKTIGSNLMLVKQQQSWFVLDVLSNSPIDAVFSAIPYVRLTPDGTKYVITNWLNPTTTIQVVDAISWNVSASFTSTGIWANTWYWWSLLGIDNQYIYLRVSTTWAIRKIDFTTWTLTSTYTPTSCYSIWKKTGNKIYWWSNVAGTYTLNVLDTTTMTNTTLWTSWAFTAPMSDGFAVKWNLAYFVWNANIRSIDLTTNTVSTVFSTGSAESTVWYYEPTTDMLWFVTSWWWHFWYDLWSSTWTNFMTTFAVPRSVIPINSSEIFIWASTAVSWWANAIIWDWTTITPISWSAGVWVTDYYYYKP